jgi:hypothetical protein
MTYKGYTLEEIRSLIEYDPDSGIFTSKRGNKVLVDRVYSVRHPETKKLDKLYLSRLAVMMSESRYLDEGDRVTFRDGDPYNNKLDNLVVVPFKEVYQKRVNNPTNTYLETEHEHVYVGSLNRLFVVRRGVNQSVYRTYSKDEAVVVRDRWLESDRTLNEWDSFTPKWYKKMLEDDEYLHILKEKSDFC